MPNLVVRHASRLFGAGETRLAVQLASLVSAYRRGALTPRELEHDFGECYLLLLLRSGGELLGCARLQPLRTRPSTAILSSVVIDPSARGRGLVRPLLAAAERTARGLAYSHVQLAVHVDNGAAQAAYARAGYVTSGRGDGRLTMQRLL